jgi:hypothetical protein
MPIPKQPAAVASASRLTKCTNKMQEQIVGSGLSGARTFIHEEKKCVLWMAKNCV